MRRLSRDRSQHGEFAKSRLHIVALFFLFLGGAVVVRLADLQIVNHSRWLARAETQQEYRQSLFPRRGTIFIQDAKAPDGLYPLATNQKKFFVYAVPQRITNPDRTARLLAPLLQLEEAALVAKLSKADDPWEPLQHRVQEATIESVKALDLPGIAFLSEPSRYYPEKEAASHVLGFVRFDGEKSEGQYGIEDYFDAMLRGKEGYMESVRDARGESVAGLGGSIVPAEDGADIVLTIDRNIQFVVCKELRAAVEKHGASGGSVVVLDPKTGAVRAMCSVPDFDPNAYRDVKDASAFNNPITFLDYEPGSIFKPITMAAGIETGAVEPETTYEDKGYVRLGVHTMRNSDGKKHGIQTMMQVLEESLNTGAIFVARKMEKEIFRQFVENFGFGKRTGIEVAAEVSGDVSSLAKPGEIYTATASFGQGITATPLQLAVAYSALANGGVLMKPYIVAEVRYPDGRREVHAPIVVRRVVSDRTAALISGMLVSVVRNGHGKRANVPGYTVGGKTGTAQIARRDGPGYEKNATIGSFVGYAPIENPAFVMLTKIDRPKDVQFAESSAAPLFGTIARFLLDYNKVEPTDSIP